NAYSAGDSKRWDRTRYRYVQPKTHDEAPVQVDTRTLSAKAEKHAQWLAANRFGPACSGVFCDLPGGRYLNAIYRGDLTAVRQMDFLHQQSVRAFFNERKKILGGGVLERVFDTAFDPNQLQLLREVANKYMYAYPVFGEACFDAGASPKKYEHVTPVVIETDEYGVTTRSGGQTFEATYTVNPEFVALRDRLATYKGAKRSDNPFNTPLKAAVYTGIVELMRGTPCRNPEVKTLERQLIALTNTVLAQPGTERPTQDIRSVLPPRVVSAPFASLATNTTQRVAWNAPVPLPQAGSTSGANRPAPPPMTRQERMQKMNTEMQAAQARFEKEFMALQQSMATARSRGADRNEQLKIMQGSQAKMLEMQQALQAEMYEIQRKYQ
ncbi:MAG: hypothetical protein AB8G16_13280, partial [Gammaproteobacteria bacterium]